MRGCHDLNGRKNLNEKSGAGQQELEPTKRLGLVSKVCFVCKIFESSLEGRILATAGSR